MSSSPKSPKHTKKDLVGFDTESALVSLEKKNSYLLEKACHLLQIKPENRTPEEINLLIKAFDANKYFKNSYTDKNTYKDFIKTCTDHLQHEYFAPGETICHYGEIGTKFYIILKGTIDCFILRTEEEINRDFAELTKPKELSDILNQTESLQNDLKLIKGKLLNFNQNMTEIIRLKKGTTTNMQNNPVLDFFKTMHQMNPNYYEECQVLKNCPDFVTLYFYQEFCRFKKIRVMYPGDYFGEVALTLSKPRIATVTAREHLHVASLNKEDYNKIFEKQIEEMNQKMNCFLSQFNSFSRDAIIKFTYEFKLVNFMANQVIFKQGDESDFLFLMKTGCVKLVKEFENGTKNSLDYNPNFVKKKKDDKKQILIALISANEFFGEDDVIRRTPRSYTAITTQISEMYYLSGEVLSGIKKNEKEFYDVIREKAAIKDKWKKERISTMEQKPLKTKSTKKRRELSLGLRAFESVNPQAKKAASSNTFQIETIRGSNHENQQSSSSRDKKMKFFESFQQQNPNIKTKKLTMELINHIVKKNSKIAKMSFNPQLLNEKNVLFEYFRNNKYQENYLKAKLFNQRTQKSSDIGLPPNNNNLYIPNHTLSILKRLKSKNNSRTEESLEKARETTENNTIQDVNAIVNNNQNGKKKDRVPANPTTINPYQLSSKQDLVYPEQESLSLPSLGTNNLQNIGTPLMSSKHNMFRVKPKNFYVMKNYYKL